MIRRRVAVRGHVQGVFFREATRRRALAAGVAGSVRNVADGTVDAVFEGERDAVERLVAFVREGPRGARVDWVDVVSEEPEDLDGFELGERQRSRVQTLSSGPTHRSKSLLNARSVAAL